MDVPIYIQDGDSTLVRFEGCGFVTPSLASSKPAPCVQRLPFPGQVSATLNRWINQLDSAHCHQFVPHCVIIIIISVCVCVCVCVCLCVCVCVVGCSVCRQCLTGRHPCLLTNLKNHLPHQCVSHRRCPLHMGPSPAEQPAGTGRPPPSGAESARNEHLLRSCVTLWLVSYWVCLLCQLLQICPEGGRLSPGEVGLCVVTFMSTMYPTVHQLDLICQVPQ